jgi:hypothetical protein
MSSDPKVLGFRKKKTQTFMREKVNMKFFNTSFFYKYTLLQFVLLTDNTA